MSLARGHERSGSRLTAYNAKRNFNKTGEPGPEIGKGIGNQFVVQKHDARRLHYDLRLELDGVLKSWAVAKGPSMVPGEKRLAIETEDHPLKYLEWEGVIPKGEYGAGTMIVWDRGVWAPVGDAHRGFKKGHLDIVLAGERLKGMWHLVRMQRKAGEKQTPWLLIKSRDEFAREAGSTAIVDEYDTSQLSGRTNEELVKQGDIRADHAARKKVRARATSAIEPPTKLKGARKGILPVFVEPSLAQLATEAPNGAHWLHEIKLDGYRLQARLDGGKIQLLTRKGLDWTARFGPIRQALEKLTVGSALIDGELIVQDDTGVSSFSGLQADLKASRKDRLAYFVFDLLYLEGIDIRGVALTERKMLLKSVTETLPADSRIHFSEHIVDDGETVLSHACRMGLEGIISKRADLPYVSGRGPHWLKSKCVLRQEFVILGYVPATAAKGAVGSLAVGYYDDTGKLYFAGRVGTGFSDDVARELRTGLTKIEAAKPTFAKRLPAGADKDVRWVSPELVAEIELRGWTSEGLLRQASFKGLREDKAPTDIRLETKPQARPAGRAPSIQKFRLTHPDRILWEGQGITKQGLAEFYADIADWILPHVGNRVLSLVRCPSGAESQCFYAKHAWQGVSDALHRVDVGDSEPMMMIDNLEGLIALVQAGVLEIHVWGSKIDDLERPDRIVMDLDPGPDVPWSTTIAAALEMRQRLKDLKLKSFVKTTGGKGLHVVVPFTPHADWEAVKAFTKELAEGMASDSPGRYVSVMTKRRRVGKIFVDYLRNGRGATAICAYSTRAQPEAPVSVPLDWSELSEAIKSNHFTVNNLHQRLEFLKRDPWAEMWKVKQRLRGA